MLTSMCSLSVILNFHHIVASFFYFHLADTGKEWHPCSKVERERERERELYVDMYMYLVQQS